MQGISRRVCLIRRVIIGYLIFLVTRQLIGVVAGISKYEYESTSAYCWNHISDHRYQVRLQEFSVAVKVYI